MRISWNLETVSILLIHSNSRTWMYGKGGDEPGRRMDTGYVIREQLNLKYLQSLNYKEPEQRLRKVIHL